MNKKVRLLITSNDVLHAWWVPALAVKRDAIPGYINESHFTATKTGIYRGQCAELCGKDHGFMPIVVKVVEQGEYDSWVKGQKAELAAAAGDSNKTFTQAELMKKGEGVYKANCAACHQANGTGGGPFPALKGSLVATTVIASLILNLATGPIMYSQAATYDFTQSSWDGVVSGVPANHNDNQVNWQNYASKDADLSAGVDLTLNTVNTSWVQSSQSDFAMGVFTASTTASADSVALDSVTTAVVLSQTNDRVVIATPRHPAGFAYVLVSVTKHVGTIGGGATIFLG